MIWIDFATCLLVLPPSDQAFHTRSPDLRPNSVDLNHRLGKPNT